MWKGITIVIICILHIEFAISTVTFYFLLQIAFVKIVLQV